ncbi:uncharacterized protein [Physcomitrium patens]|uniref:SAM domain-containing protein n=1 Tax=Physcomitrium patens TaxID=3218 RepID=A0A7I4AAV1_PHYPA|nr:uncharacterized protein LOC112289056 isoform X2 [Physcomitrium patens]|eukprot:XP_024389761.1 uncharacterized protein LOC112289056 isoform X2 [Physcomitrella patens]
MAKTKRKQLAALAGLDLTSSETPKNIAGGHQDGHCPDKNSASLEVRQQRIIFWIPPSDPSPRLASSRSFRVSGAVSRKRKRSNNDGEEYSSSDGEEGHVYQKYAKIILKLDKRNLEKGVDALPPSNASPLNAGRAYQRRKPGTRILTKEKMLSALTVNDNSPASPSVQVCKKTTAEEKDEHLPGSLSADVGENANGFASGDTIARESSSSQYSRRLSLRTRKPVSYSDLVYAKPAPQKLRNEQDEAITNRKMILNPTTKFVIASEKEADPTLGTTGTQQITSPASKRRKSKLLRDTRPQHEKTLVRADAQVTALEVADNKRKLRSVEEMTNDISESLSGGGVRGASAESASKKETAPKKKPSKFARSMTVIGIGTEQSPTNDSLELARFADSPSHREGKTVADRSTLPSKMINNASSPVVKAKLLRRSSAALEKQDELAPLHTSVLRIRKRVLTPVKGKNSASTALFTKKMKASSLAALDNCKATMVSGLGSVPSSTEARSSESGARVPLLHGSTRDHLMHHHHESDVVTSSNNAMALNSRSRRISFLGRNAGGFMEEEDPLKRAYLQRSLMSKEFAHSHANNVTTSGSRIRDHDNGCSRLGARVASHSFRNHVNGYNVKGFKTNRHSVELIKQQYKVSRDSKSRRGGLGCRLLSLKPSGFKRINPSVDLAAVIRSKLEEVGGLTEWLISGGLGVFVDLFQERKVQERDLLHLTMGSLKEISGVQAKYMS